MSKYNFHNVCDGIEIEKKRVFILISIFKNLEIKIFDLIEKLTYLLSIIILYSRLY